MLTFWHMAHMRRVVLQIDMLLHQPI